MLNEVLSLWVFDRRKTNPSHHMCRNRRIRTRRDTQRATSFLFEFWGLCARGCALTFAHKMDKETHQDAPKKDSTGCVLLGLFPFVLVGSVFAAGALEESGNKFAGWLWIPLSIVVMFVFAIIRYSTTRSKDQPFSSIMFTKSVFGFVFKQILVLLALGLIAMLLARLNPFSGMGNNW